MKIIDRYEALVEAIKGDRGKHFLAYRKSVPRKVLEEVRERDFYICQGCGAPRHRRALDVHHIDGNRWNDDPDNLITFCQQCHAYEHQSEEGEKE